MAVCHRVIRRDLSKKAKRELQSEDGNKPAVGRAGAQPLSQGEHQMRRLLLEAGKGLPIDNAGNGSECQYYVELGKSGERQSWK